MWVAPACMIIWDGPGLMFQEFLVGKTAAPFVTQYHNLHHFKYRLYQRCRAKVGVHASFLTQERPLVSSKPLAGLWQATWLILASPCSALASPLIDSSKPPD